MGSFNYPLVCLLARLLDDARPRPTTSPKISGRLLDILSHKTRSLPRRVNNTLARAGEDRSRCSRPGFPAAVRLTIYICRPSGRSGYRSKEGASVRGGGVGKTLPEQGRSR